MELRPPSLDSLGLEDALRGYAEEWATTSGIAVEIVTHGLENIDLPVTAETTIYRVVQEALTNILKHAQATHVSIILEQRSDLLRTIVEDDGVGFALETVRKERSGGQQLGLVGMAERATLVGGTLTVESEPGRGTTIYLHIPLRSEHQERPRGDHA
jgi:signal transduction histidine kinase